MANREQRLARASWLMARDLDEVAGELRRARHAAGLTLQAVAAEVGVSHATVLRNERGHRGVPPMTLARHAATLGLRARVRVYPDGDAIRDAAQAALIRRFRQQVGEAGTWAFEVPIPLPNDRRALDAVLTVSAGQVGLEFYTRLADAQAQLRAATLKKRDAGLERLVVVIQDTRANRRALHSADEILVSALPGSSRALLRALRAGELPNTDGVIAF